MQGLERKRNGGRLLDFDELILAGDVDARRSARGVGRPPNIAGNDYEALRPDERYWHWQASREGWQGNCAGVVACPINIFDQKCWACCREVESMLGEGLDLEALVHDNDCVGNGKPVTSNLMARMVLT